MNATIGFEGLAAEINKPSKSLHRMLAPRGNPNKLLRHRESITEKDTREASRDGQGSLSAAWRKKRERLSGWYREIRMLDNNARTLADLHVPATSKPRRISSRENLP